MPFDKSKIPSYDIKHCCQKHKLQSEASILILAIRKNPFFKDPTTLQIIEQVEN